MTSKVSSVIQLYIKEEITIGKAAQLAELSSLEFETILSKNRIPISNLDEKDVLGDLLKISKI